jgi:hypothetical protein
MQFDVHLRQQAANVRFYCINGIQGGMMMPGELYTSMQSDTVYELKKLRLSYNRRSQNHLPDCKPHNHLSLPKYMGNKDCCNQHINHLLSSFNSLIRFALQRYNK